MEGGERLTQVVAASSHNFRHEVAPRCPHPTRAVAGTFSARPIATHYTRIHTRPRRRFIAAGLH